MATIYAVIPDSRGGYKYVAKLINVRVEEPPPPPRPVIVGINVPADGETLEELNAWRRRYGLPPVEEGWNEE